MPPLVLVSTIFIVLAFIFYTIGIWSERKARELKRWHVVLMWLGFLCDATGTSVMVVLAGASFDLLHGGTGALALLLMLGNAIWATYVYRTKDERAQAVFTKFSVVVWLIWLIPFVGGLVLGMSK